MPVRGDQALLATTKPTTGDSIVIQSGYDSPMAVASGLLERTYAALTRGLTPRAAGRMDLRRPRYWASWGGPLNGQEHRREMVRELARAYRFSLVVETGTYRGSTTEFLAAVFPCDIETVEANPRNHEFSSRRLAPLARVKVRHSDSRSLLRSLPPISDPVFVYLDAHWEDDLPLAEELEIIAAKWPAAVVMIDDFAVPGDPGYQYDDYGQGKALKTDYLPDAVADWHRFYPGVPSHEETGARRGSVVLLGPAIEPVAFATMHHRGN